MAAFDEQDYTQSFDLRIWKRLTPFLRTYRLDFVGMLVFNGVCALVDVVLQCGSIEGPLQLGSVAARIAQLYLIDVLFSEMCRRDMERCRHQRELVAEALSEKHV